MNNALAQYINQQSSTDSTSKVQEKKKIPISEWEKLRRGETVKENGGRSRHGSGTLYIKPTLKTSEIILPSLLHHQHHQWQFSLHLLRPCTAVGEEVGPRVIIPALHSQTPQTIQGS